MQQIDIGASLNFGWERFKANAVFHILAMLVILSVSAFTLYILAGPLLVGYVRALIKAEQRGGALELNDLFSGFDRFLPSLVLFVLFAILTMLSGGLVGLLSPILWVAIYLLAQGESDWQAALKRAWELSSLQLPMLIVGGVVFSIVGSAGLLLCCIGIFVTLPMTALANFHMVRTLVDGSQRPPTTPEQWG